MAFLNILVEQRAAVGLIRLNRPAVHNALNDTLMTELGQALLGAGRDRRLWAAGRVKIDDWGARPAAELHIDDIAFAD